MRLFLASLLGASVARAAPLTNSSARPCTNTYPPGLHEIELESIGRKFLLAVPDGLLAGATFQVELPTNAPIRAVSAKPKPRVTRGGVGSDTV